MPPFFFALIATLLAATGGRDQRMAANLSAKLGQSTGLLVTLWLTCAASAALAAAIGAGMAQLLPSPGAKTMFIAFALLLGALELAWPFLWKEPEEPTRSLFAIAFVVASRQLLDAARFIVVALAAATGAPVLAAIGGTIGGGAAVTLGWALGEGLTARYPLRGIRLAIAALLLVAAIWTGMSARGII